MFLFACAQDRRTSQDEVSSFLFMISRGNFLFALSIQTDTATNTVSAVLLVIVEASSLDPPARVRLKEVNQIEDEGKATM